MALSELLKIVTPPEKPKEVPAKPDWKTVEKKIGMQLPDDYKRYVTTFGSGVLGNFICVLNPFSKSAGFEFFSGVELLSSTLRDLKRIEGSEYIPFEIYPKSPGLLPRGADENGNSLFWLTNGTRNKWPVVVCTGRDSRYQIFEMGITSFLAKTFTGEVKCEIWPKPFAGPKRHYDFQPY